MIGKRGRRIAALAVSAVAIGAVLPVGATAQVPLGYPPIAEMSRVRQLYMEGYHLPPVTATPAYPAWSPDGKRIAFSYRGYVWSVPAGGGPARQLTIGPGYHSQPAWSPDGRRLAYVVDRDRNLDLWVKDLETGGERRLTRHSQVDVSPRWSPDGRRILFTSARGGNLDLWTLEPGSLALERLTDHPSPDISGDWVGPDGDIVFVSARSALRGSGSLWTRASEAIGTRAEDGAAEEAAGGDDGGSGDEERVPTILREEETLFQTTPTSSPDGRLIAYASYAPGPYDLMLLPASGGQPVRLTTSPWDEYMPAWSPGGDSLAYVDNRDGVFRLRTVSRHGGDTATVAVTGFEWRDPVGTLAVRVVDAEGNPASARLRIRDASGRDHFPRGSYPRFSNVGREFYFHHGDSFELTVPAGSVRVEAMRGFEHVPVEVRAEVEPDGRRSVELRLRRWSDLGAEGWHSGDTHIHMNYGGHYGNTPGRLLREVAAEDLDVANSLVANTHTRIHDLEHFGESHHSHDGDHWLHFSEEFRPNFYGHTTLLGLERPVTPFYNGYEGTAFSAPSPPNATVAERVRDQDGLIGYSHPFGYRDEVLAYRDPAAGDYGSGRELPVDVALGRVDFLELGNIWSDEITTARVWYRLLSCGYRLAAAAGTDAMPDVWRHPAVGSTRVYVRTGGERVDHGAWLAGLREGRSFVTNGPLLRLEAGGQGMGEELRVEPGETVRVEASARSIFPMHRLELVFDGEVVGTVHADSGGHRAVLRDEVTVERSGWLAVRALGPAQPGLMDSYLFAHTNPVFLTVPDRPARSPADAAYFRRWIERSVELLREMESWETPEQRDEVVSLFQLGLERLGAQCGGRP